jgi:uncharacterized OB-fold protein
MSEARTEAGPLPVVPFLKIPSDGEPYLEGSDCQKCHAICLGRRSACPKCGARDSFSERKLSNRGVLYAYSIVHRSFPGVAVPYISAIVDLEGGGSIKANLVDIEPDPAKLTFGMPVEVVFGDALGRKDDKGRSYVSYFVRPCDETSRRSR